MANWFKIYETDLDETRMKFALSKLPEVWPVWTAVLMECCRHRKDSFPWGKDEQELFGFSDRLKIPIPKVNTAVHILCEIRYVTITDGTLTVLKWNEKQDDYLARKSRGYWKKRRESRNLTVNHCDSHIEERRGEEKIREEKEDPDGASAPVGAFILKEFPEPLRSARVMNKWTVWQTVRRGMKKANWLTLFDSQIEWLSQFNEPKVFEILDQSIRNGWQGLFEPKTNYATKPPAENPRNFGMPTTGKQAGERAVAELRARGDIK